MFDNLVAKCPNPSCYSDMKLEMQDIDNRIASFKCIKKDCKVDIVSMQISLTTIRGKCLT